MTSENPGTFSITKVAAADLSSSINRIVKLSTGADTVEAITASTDIPFGILRNKPETDEEASIIPCNSGVEVRCELGATLGADDIVSIDAVGKIAAAASGNYRIGILTKGGADTEIGSVLLNPQVPQA